MMAAAKDPCPSPWMRNLRHWKVTKRADPMMFQCAPWNFGFATKLAHSKTGVASCFQFRDRDHTDSLGIHLL
jgi:hypothetical protein